MISQHMPMSSIINQTDTILYIKDWNGVAGTSPITITPFTGDTIEGATSYVINTNYGCVTLHSSPSSNKWLILSKV